MKWTSNGQFKSLNDELSAERKMSERASDNKKGIESIKCNDLQGSSF